MKTGGLNEAIREAGMTHAEYKEAMELTKEAREKYIASLETKEQRKYLTSLAIHGTLRSLFRKWTKDGMFRPK